MSGSRRTTSATGPTTTSSETRQPPGLLTAILQNYGSQLGLAMFSLGNALITSRALGPTGRGELAFLTSIAFLASSTATVGVQEANVNLAGAEPHQRRSLATNSLILSLLFGLLAAGVIVVLFAVLPASEGGASHVLLALVLASLPMLVLSIYLRLLIQGDYGWRVTSLAWVLPAVVNFTVNGTLALFGALTVASALSTWIAGQLLGLAMLAHHVRRHSVGFGRPDLALAKRTLRFGARSHIGRVMLLANYRLDQWILGAIAGPAALGLYSVAVAWAEALFLLPTALADVQRPDVVRARPGDAVHLAARMLRTSLVLTVVMAGALVVLAPFLCTTIFGPDFSGSVRDLRILAFGAFGIVALKQLGGALTGRNRPTAASLSVATAFVSTVVLDIVLIPAHDDLGASIASAVSYSVGGVVVAIVFARTLGARMRDLVPRPDDVRETWEGLRHVISVRRAQAAGR